MSRNSECDQDAECATGNGICFDKMLPEDVELLKSHLDKVESEAAKSQRAGAGGE